MDRLALFVIPILFALNTALARPDSLDCGKILQPLCRMLAGAEDTSKFVIGIAFAQPPRDTTCDGIDPKIDTSGRCDRSKQEWDSTFKAQVLAYAHDLFTTHELWYSNSPSSRIPPPTQPETFFKNVLATKATILELNNESYVIGLEHWYIGTPGRLFPKPHSHVSESKTGGNAYLINGRKVEIKPSSRLNSVLPGR